MTTEFITTLLLIFSLATLITLYIDVATERLNAERAARDRELCERVDNMFRGEIDTRYLSWHEAQEVRDEHEKAYDYSGLAPTQNHS